MRRLGRFLLSLIALVVAGPFDEPSARELAAILTGGPLPVVAEPVTVCPAPASCPIPSLPPVPTPAA